MWVTWQCYKSIFPVVSLVGGWELRLSRLLWTATDMQLKALFSLRCLTALKASACCLFSVTKHWNSILGWYHTNERETALGKLFHGDENTRSHWPSEMQNNFLRNWDLEQMMIARSHHLQWTWHLEDLLRQVAEQFHGTVSFISTQIRVGPTLDSSWTTIKVSPHSAPACKV